MRLDVEWQHLNDMLLVLRQTGGIDAKPIFGREIISIRMRQLS
jgi:hypothetical protein